MSKKPPKPIGNAISNLETIKAMEAARAGDLVKVGSPGQLLESLNATQPPDVKAGSTR